MRSVLSDWHAIVIEGGEAATRGFVLGVLGECGADPDAIAFGNDVGVGSETLGERVVEFLTGSRRQLVLASDAVATALIDALTRTGVGAHLRLAEHRRVTAAVFGFRVETFSRDVARDVHAALEAVPVGVRVADRNEESETHPDETPIELFMPGHPYVYRARGRIEGSVDGVMAVRRRLAASEAVELDTLSLLDGH